MKKLLLTLSIIAGLTVSSFGGFSFEDIVVGPVLTMDISGTLKSYYEGAGVYAQMPLLISDDGTFAGSFGAYTLLDAKCESHELIVQPHAAMSMFVGKMVNLPTWLPLEVGVMIAIPIRYQTIGLEFGIIRFNW